mgnify:FL=1|jgi:hypothetical protein
MKIQELVVCHVSIVRGGIDVRVLILRTFAHTRVWDDRDRCEYEFGQAAKINAWEPGYRSITANQIDFAIGIYMPQYFTYSGVYGKPRPVFAGTVEEQIPSLIQLKGRSKKSFVRKDAGDNAILIKFEVVKKLWSEPDRSRMRKLNWLLLQRKVQEVKQAGIQVNTNDPFKPLSFTLGYDQVVSAFGEIGIEWK